MIETKNAVIESANFDTERGLSAWVHLNYGGSGQGFGGYVLYVPKDWGSYTPNQANYCGHFVYRCLQIAGVDDWSKLKGKTVRVRCEHSKVHAIGHIVNDDWFDPSKDFEELRRAQQR